MAGFRRLALCTTAVTYLLILVGGLVRASGAGLGCPDWPRCFGGWIPPASAADLPSGFDPSQFNPTLMWTEYLNRLLGVTVGLLVMATVISAWRHYRDEPHVLWTTIAALLLTVFQGWLGGQVVAAELAPWIVTVHMIVALVIVSLLLYATVFAIYAPVAPAAPRRGLVTAGSVLIAITLIQVALGTQVRGRVDQALDAGVARDAALATVGTLDYAHRDVSLAVLGAGLVLLLIQWSRHSGTPPIARWINVTLALMVLQIALGAVMAYVSLVPAAQVLHLTVASLMLGAETVVVLLALWLPASEPAPG